MTNVTQQPTASNQAGHDEGGRGVALLWRLVSRRTSAVVTFNRNGNAPPFYCIHPITGDVTSFNSLTRALGPEQPFYGIQVPRDKMTPEFATSIEAMAHYYVAMLLKFQPTGDIVLGGWSAGAIIALEMAQQLRALGRSVPLLVGLDGAPCNTGAGISPWDPRYAWRLTRNVPRWVTCQVRQNPSARALGRKILEKFMFHTATALPAVHGPQTLHRALAQEVLSSTGWREDQKGFICALYRAMQTYVPAPYAGRVLVYEARTQPLYYLLQVGAAWRSIATLTEIVPQNGNHETILQEPQVEVLARDLRQRLARLDRDSDARTPADNFATGPER